VPSAPLPPSNYRFWGRLTAPDGHRLLMLARGSDGQPVTIDSSTKLEDGWAVESIGDNGVVLVHAASQRRERIPIPAEAPAAPG
jgi:outer membrane usher protein FimD/PapC